MTLLEKISEDLKLALKSGDKIRLEAIRSAKTALLLAGKEKSTTAELSDLEAISIIQKLVKQRKESADIFKSQNRIDLYEQEIKEMQVLKEYLPKPLTDEELTKYLQNLIEKFNITSLTEMGKIMQTATKELAGKADGKTISEKVKELLDKK